MSADYLFRIRSTADLSGLTAARAGVEALGQKIKGSFTGLGSVYGLLTGGALVGLGKELLQQADHLQDLATASNTSAEALQRLAAATREDGVETEALAASLGKLALFQGKVAAGDKEALKITDRLGLKASTVGAQDRVSLFYDLADALSAIPSAAERSRLSVALFSDAGQALLPTLLQGKTALLEMGDAATVMSNKTVAELAKVNSELEKGILSMKTFAGSALAEVLNKVGQAGVAIATIGEQDRINQEYQDAVARYAADPKGLTPAQAAKIRDQQLANLLKVAENNFQNPLGADAPAATTPDDPPAAPAKPAPSPLDKASPATLSDRITSIGGIIAGNATALRAADRTANATERTATGIERLLGSSILTGPRTATFSP